MRLRRMRWWDLAAVVELEHQLFPTHPWSAESWWGELALGDARAYLVAEDEPVGLLGYGGISCHQPARGADAEIMTLAVAARAQRRGVGQSMLAALREIAAQRGAGRILLEVGADNQAAQNLYAAAGFEQMSLRHGYYQPTAQASTARPDVDAMVMSLSLAGSPAPPPSERP